MNKKLSDKEIEKILREEVHGLFQYVIEHNEIKDKENFCLACLIGLKLALEGKLDEVDVIKASGK